MRSATAHAARRGSPAARTLGELARAIRSARDPRERREFEADWHRRLALPISTICFGALAVPLSLRPRRLSRSSGAIAGIAAMWVMWRCSSSRRVDPDGAVSNRPRVWLPDLALLAASGVLAAGRRFRARARGSGGAGSARRPASRYVGRLVLPRYLVVRFVEIGALCFVALLIRAGADRRRGQPPVVHEIRSTLDEVMRFYAARMPLLVSRVRADHAARRCGAHGELFGVTGELIGMRACGISAIRIAIPIPVPCVVVAVGYREAIDGWFPRDRTRHADQTRRDQGAGDRAPVGLVARPRPSLPGRPHRSARRVAQGITIYELNAIGLPTSRTDAEAARHLGEGPGTCARRADRGRTRRRAARRPARAGQVGDEFATERDGRSSRSPSCATRSRAPGARLRRDRLPAWISSPSSRPARLPRVAGARVLVHDGGPPFRTPAQILLISVALLFVHFVLSAFFVSLGLSRRRPRNSRPVGRDAASRAALTASCSSACAVRDDPRPR